MNALPYAIGIHLKVSNIGKSRAFYESLGLVPAFAYGDPDFLKTIPPGTPTASERYRGVAYKLESGELEIAEGHIAVPKREVFAEEIVSPKISAMLRVKSLAAVLSLGTFQLKFPVRHYYWGTIEPAFRDPDGFVIVAITPFTPEELSAVAAIVHVESIAAPPANSSEDE